MNKLDEFFKKKVDAHQVEPRPEAWSKLESNLSKKNKGLTGFRIAAALLLMGALITSIIWLQRTDGNPSLASQVVKENSSKTQEEVKINKDETTPTKAPEENKIVNLKKQKALKKQKDIQSKDEPKANTEEQNELEVERVPVEPTLTEIVAAATVVEKPIVIEYTLESIPLRKKETAVAAVEKKNSLQKAIDFAREAKNSDSPLGGLRQAKDDLFALNFKKDKQKKQ